MSTIINYRTNETMNIDGTDPQYKREKDRGRNQVTTLSLKMAPIRILSTELNYIIEENQQWTLATGETQGLTVKFDVGAKTSLTEKASIDTRYSSEVVNQSSDISRTETASLKGLWDLTPSWSISAQGSFARKRDNLAVSNPLTYTVSPSIGFIFRLENKLRVDGQYTLSKSFQGASTQKEDYSLKTKYDVSEYVHISLRYEQESAHDPDYRSTELQGTVEINI
jgi:hypothetical protein